MPFSKLQALAVSLSVACIWCVNILHTKAYFLLVSLIHYEGLYLTNAVCCFVATGFVFIFLPETKNISLAKVQESFDQKKNLINKEEEEPVV